MSLLEELALAPFSHRTSEAWRINANRQVKGRCFDFLILEHQQDDAQAGVSTVESSAAALRPSIPILLTVLMAFFSMIGVNRSSATSADIRLLALVPPGTEVVAGIRAASLHGHCGNDAFITNDNKVDLTDFIAITGSDESRIFDQVIFTASSGHDGRPHEHGILVSGHFDYDRIFRTPSGNETVVRYRGVAILDVSPFERERSFFQHRRWLAFLGSSIAIFGTVASAEAEIDRGMDGSPPDQAILQRLARLLRDDEEWSLLPAIGHGTAVLHQLRLLDPSLAGLAENGHSLAIGIRYGRRVELEFAVDLKSKSGTTSMSVAASMPSADLRNHESLLSSRPGPYCIGDPVVHRFFKLSKGQFEKWVAQASSAAHEVFPSALKRSTQN